MGKHVNIEESTVLFQNCCKTEITRRIKQHNPPFDMNFTRFRKYRIEISLSNTFKYLPSLRRCTRDSSSLLLLPLLSTSPNPFRELLHFLFPSATCLIKTFFRYTGCMVTPRAPSSYRLNSSSRGLLDCFSVLRFECHCCCCFLHEVLENRFFKRNVVLE